MAKKYKITNKNPNKVNISLIGLSNQRTVPPGGDLYLGELSDEVAEAYRKAYNSIGCCVKEIIETPLTKCITEKIKPAHDEGKCCDTVTVISSEQGEQTKNSTLLDDSAREDMLADEPHVENPTPAVVDMAPVSEPAVKADESAVSEQSEEKPESPKYTAEQLDEMTKAQLLEIASDLDIQIKGTINKSALRDKILEAM